MVYCDKGFTRTVGKRVGKMHAGLIIMIICEKWSRRGKCQEFLLDWEGCIFEADIFV